ncbi:T9SS type A sorting domain-containing protein [Hymenobacter sp. HMF4947]|uniref:T9SS type A sorting domain-containing protein n=1 Tax=Hymenobacter ginkgonis TaxID=2682976 RepID=A0A7K1TBM2_9BACT|nr:T9SS type A sorting domain-containing protein [Hymenobacter ginkgonis]MVN75807.1 T9SS type A sorting domain-containing protein [Hymenobacter ginkgonis]
MYNISLPSRIAFLFLFLLGFAAHPSAAQTQYGAAVTSKSGLIDTPDDAADGDLTTKAILKPTLLLTSPMLRVKFKSLAAAGKPAGVYLKTDNVLALALLGTASIRTFMGTQELERFNIASDVLSLALQNTDVKNLTFTPTKAFDQIQVDYISLAALGKDIEFYEAYTSVTPLPVTLLTFQAKATSTGAALTWDTASELNADYFVVERADDSPDTFRALGQVQSAGTSTQARHYQFVDATPARLSYYRLRQVDQDGTATYGPVVVLATEPQSAALAAYPSPATETLTVTGPAGAHFVVLDQLGRQVQHVDMVLNQQQIDVRNLPAGSYFLQDAATGKSTRFIKATGDR